MKSRVAETPSAPSTEIPRRIPGLWEPVYAFKGIQAVVIILFLNS